MSAASTATSVYEAKLTNNTSSSNHMKNYNTEIFFPYTEMHNTPEKHRNLMDIKQSSATTILFRKTPVPLLKHRTCSIKKRSQGLQVSACAHWVPFLSLLLGVVILETRLMLLKPMMLHYNKLCNFINNEEKKPSSLLCFINKQIHIVHLKPKLGQRAAVITSVGSTHLLYKGCISSAGSEIELLFH